MDMRSELTREVVSGGSDIHVLSRGVFKVVPATVLEGSRAGLDGCGPEGAGAASQTPVWGQRVTL